MTATGERRLARPASPPLLPLLLDPRLTPMCVSVQPSVKPLLGLSFRLDGQPRVKPLLGSSFKLNPVEHQALARSELQARCQAERRAAPRAELQAASSGKKATTSHLLHDRGILVLTGTGERRLARPASPPLLPLLTCPRLTAMCLPLQPNVKLSAHSAEHQAAHWAELQAVLPSSFRW